MRAAVVGLVLLLCGCASHPAGESQDYVTAEYAPTFEIDDPADGLFPNKSPRVGEKAYAYRFRVGVEREYENGMRLYGRAGMENQHVAGVEVGIRVPVGR